MMKKSGNSIDIRSKIKRSTLALLDMLFLSESERCGKKRLVVWLDTDGLTFNSFVGFEQELEEYWSVERGYVFENVVLKQGKPDSEGRKVEADIEALDIYLQEQVSNPLSETIARKACISVFGMKGSLLQDRYELSSETMKKEGRKYYNIGRGAFPQTDDGNYRQNHIVVDDQHNLEVNGFVSRAHARIGFSESIGFYLQVERGGSRLYGNRTRVFRGEEKIELESVEVKVPLKNGDLIELGKAVVLKYEEIE